MDLKTDLLPSLKKYLSIIKFLRPPHYHGPALSSYTRYTVTFLMTTKYTLA